MNYRRIKFKLSKSIILNIIINLSILGQLFIIILLLYTGRGYFLLPFLALMLGYSIYIWYSPACYIVDVKNKKLKVIFGFTRKNYDIDKFLSIKKSNNPISAPAKSLKRVEMHSSEDGMILISPKDRDKFIEEIKRINPNLK